MSDFIESLILSCQTVPLNQTRTLKPCAAVYALACSESDKLYVGGSSNVQTRVKDHRNKLIRKEHGNIRVQSEFDKHGIVSFFVIVLEYLENPSSEMLDKAEQKWMDAAKLNSIELFNLHPNASGPSGWKHTIEAKDKIRKAGANQRPERRAQVAEANKARVQKPETIAKLSALKKGVPLPEEVKAKISASLKGRVFSDETRAKISEAGIRRRQREREERGK